MDKENIFKKLDKQLEGTIMEDWDYELQAWYPNTWDEEEGWGIK